MTIFGVINIYNYDFKEFKLSKIQFCRKISIFAFFILVLFHSFFLFFLQLAGWIWQLCVTLYYCNDIIYYSFRIHFVSNIIKIMFCISSRKSTYSTLDQIKSLINTYVQFSLNINTLNWNLHTDNKFLVDFPADLNHLRPICRASATGNHNKNNIIAGIESRLLPGWIRGSLQLICFRVFRLARESLQKVLKTLQAVQKESNGFWYYVECEAF